MFKKIAILALILILVQIPMWETYAMAAVYDSNGQQTAGGKPAYCEIAYQTC